MELVSKWPIKTFFRGAECPLGIKVYKGAPWRGMWNRKRHLCVFWVEISYSCFSWPYEPKKSTVVIFPLKKHTCAVFLSNPLQLRQCAIKNNRWMSPVTAYYIGLITRPCHHYLWILCQMGKSFLNILLENTEGWTLVKHEPCRCSTFISKLLHLSFQLIFAHDTCRVIQCLVKYGTSEHRTKLFEELKDDILEMIKCKYAKFFVKKLIKYGWVDSFCKMSWRVLKKKLYWLLGNQSSVVFS
jgi:hypothetical protein